LPGEDKLVVLLKGARNLSARLDFIRTIKGKYRNILRSGKEEKRDMALEFAAEEEEVDISDGWVCTAVGYSA